MLRSNLKKALCLTLVIQIFSGTYSRATSKDEEYGSLGNEDRSSLIKLSPQSSLKNQGTPSEQEWAEIEKFIVKGLEKSCKYENLEPSTIHSARDIFQSFYNDFKILYCNGAKLKNNSVNLRALKTLLPTYVKFLTCALNAFDVEMKVLGGAFENKFGVTSRSKVIENYDTALKPFFTKFQKVSHIFLSSLNDLGVFNLQEDIGIIPVDTYTIGYCKDQNGFVPFIFKPTNDFLLMNLIWGQFDPHHQRAFLIKNNSFTKESGFISTVTKSTLKLQGYYGSNSSLPYSSYPTTLRIVDIEKSNDFYTKILTEAVGKENLKDGKVGFIPLPSTKAELDVLEILFLEEIIEAASESQHPDYKQGLEYKVLLEEKYNSSIKDQKNKLETSLLNDFEQEIAKEQEKISAHVASGEIYNKPNKEKNNLKAKKSKNIKNINNKKNQKQENKKVEINPKLKAKEAYEKHKVESRVKFKGIKGILNNLLKDLSSSKKIKTIIKGSHINIHGEEGKGTSLVHLHGNKESAPSQVVNALISNLISLLQKD